MHACCCRVERGSVDLGSLGRAQLPECPLRACAPHMRHKSAPRDGETRALRGRAVLCGHGLMHGCRVDCGGVYPPDVVGRRPHRVRTRLCADRAPLLQLLQSMFVERWVMTMEREARPPTATHARRRRGVGQGARARAPVGALAVKPRAAADGARAPNAWGARTARRLAQSALELLGGACARAGRGRARSPQRRHPCVCDALA